MREYQRVYLFSDYCKETFGRKLRRAPLDIGCTCPNRDGTIGTGGCIFCSGAGSGDFAAPYAGEPVNESTFPFLRTGNYRPGDMIAYFQSYTNTYGDPDRLHGLFAAALNDPVFAGISIGTRPDCLGPAVLSLLKDLKETFPQKFIWVELGLQTIHEETARLIRRGYPFAVYDQAVRDLRNLDIPVITHVILGLPGETKEMMTETIRALNGRTWGIKLQLLHILKDTDLYPLYQQGGFEALTEEAYLDILCACIGWLSPEIVVHRLTGDGSAENLAAPLWSTDKRRVLNDLRHELKVRNVTQGCFL